MIEIYRITYIDTDSRAMHLLDIDQLRTFVAISDTGSFTRAADVVHKTQSAVSMQMKRLEERVGRPVFERDGRASKLTEDGERVLDYARRIVRLNSECVASFNEADLTGRVRLGLPDDYADCYLPEILARFSRSNPRAEMTVACEPTPNLLDRIQNGDLDLAIITHVDRRGPSEIVRVEQLLWVTSSRHGVHEETPVPLALGRPTCDWRQSATDALQGIGRPFRVLFVSWHSTAVGAAVNAGLAVSVLPESAIRSGMRILGPSDGFPALPSCKIGLVRNTREENFLADALATQIKQSLDNLGAGRVAPPMAQAAE
jgi:DNA-binding transcriptional LysR family regulator